MLACSFSHGWGGENSAALVQRSPNTSRLDPRGALAQRMQSEEAACRARSGTVRLMTPARTTFAPQHLGTRSRARLEVIGAPEHPSSAMGNRVVWSNRHRPDPRPDATGLGVRAGPKIKGWPQVAADIATSTAGGAAVLVNRPTWPGRSLPASSPHSRSCPTTSRCSPMPQAVPPHWTRHSCSCTRCPCRLASGAWVSTQLSREDAPCSRPGRACLRRRGPLCEL